MNYDLKTAKGKAFQARKIRSAAVAMVMAATGLDAYEAANETALIRHFEAVAAKSVARFVGVAA